MNQKTKRTTICIGTFLLLLTFMPSSASLASSVPNETATETIKIPSTSTGANTITPYANSIVWKYRVYNGQLQKRRWNETTASWVDSHWINC